MTKEQNVRQSEVVLDFGTFVLRPKGNQNVLGGETTMLSKKDCLLHQQR